MTKQELSEMLHEVGIPVNEWIVSQKNENSYPRIVYWPFVDDDIPASGDVYQDIRTYQVSFHARVPDHPKLKKIRSVLREHDLHPTIYHEYVKEDDVFHSYFSLEVIDDE